MSSETSEETLFQPEGEPKRVRIFGEIWPPSFTADLVRSAKLLTPRDDDVFVCTYSKSGTTWASYICFQIFYKNYKHGDGNELCMTAPLFEKRGAKFAEKLPSPRILKTHFKYEDCPKNPKAKYIYCVRNPKDCLTSFYFHTKLFKTYNWENGEFDVFYDLFMKGEVDYGDYFEHLKTWLPHIDDPNVLLLKYEDMLEDLETAVKKIGSFLGGKATEVVNDEESLKEIVLNSNVESMKKDQGRWYPESALRQPTFVRKGAKRDWKNYLSKQQSDELDKKFDEMLGGTVCQDWWNKELSWD